MSIPNPADGKGSLLPLVSSSQGGIYSRKSGQERQRDKNKRVKFLISPVIHDALHDFLV